MRKLILITIVLVFIINPESVAVSTVNSLIAAPLSKVYIYKSGGSPRHFINTISGNGGWKSGFVGFAEAFSEINSLVLGVDIGNYFKDLRQSTSDYYTVAADLANNTTDAALISLPSAGHGFLKWSHSILKGKESYIQLTEKYEKTKPMDFNIDQIAKLPLVITNAISQNKDVPVALLISGDGGWYGFEQSIADYFAKLDIPTVGLDSRKYFWNRRTPEETASDLAKALNFYCNKWGRGKFILVGYSLGAEIVPFIFNRLPEDMKHSVLSAVLLSPESNTDFEVHITNMLGMGSRQNTYDVLKEINAMPELPTLIIIGEGEKNTVPSLLKGTAVKVRLIPGDHHYKSNISLIIQTMRENNAF